MSKAVLLAINAKYVHSSLSVWILADSVSRYARLAHDVTIVEATINQHNDYIVEQIIAHNPDVVGISTYIWNGGKLPELLNILRKQLPKAVFVLGGPESSNNPEYWMIYADYILRGEGERSFPAFLDMISGNNSPESIPGLCWKQDGKTRLNPELQFAEDFIDPYSEDYFAALNCRIAYIETSRGCPFRCGFCLSGGSGGVRFLPLDDAKERLLRLSQSGTRTIKFVDRTFNCDRKRAYELFAYVIGLDTGCCFHFEVAADLFDGHTLSLLSTAPPGRIQLEAGLQSFFEPALQASSRQTDLAKAEENIRALLRGGNIHVHVDLIAGLPYETLSDFRNSFDRAYALGAHTLQLGFLKLLHGSALREQEKQILCRDEPPYEITSSPWLSPEDLKLLKQTENALQHTYNKGRFLSALRYALSASGVKPFTLYYELGKATQNHGTPLKDYAKQIYSCLADLPGISPEILRENMICDWLGMVRGANLPDFLKGAEGRRQVVEIAEGLLGRKIRRHEAAVLPSGRSVFVDSENRDPVTGLYRLCQLEAGHNTRRVEPGSNTRLGFY